MNGRRAAWFAVTVAGAVALWLALRSPRPPNIVIIAVDTLRADALGFYGAPGDPSPRLDALLRESVAFEHAIAAAPWTLPSFASLFTGLYPPAHGANDVDKNLVARHYTIAESLRERGYRTAGFTAGGYLKKRYGLHQGFDVFDERTETGKFSEKLGRAIEWADDGDPNEPWFLFLHGYDVHAPFAPDRRPPPPPGYSPPDEALARRLVERMEGSGSIVDLPPSRVIPAYLTVEPTGGRSELVRFRKAFVAWEKRYGSSVEELWSRAEDFASSLAWVKANYDAEVRQLDEELAPLLAFLDREDVRGDTIVILVSDHGEGFMEDGVCDHEVVQEEVVHVPFAVRLPDVAPRRVDIPVRAIDLFPTLSSLVDAPLPPFFQGRSLAPLLRGDALPHEPALSFQDVPRSEHGAEASVLFNGWKLIEGPRFGSLDPPVTLIELTGDRDTNVAAAHPSRVEFLRDVLRRTRAQSARFLANVRRKAREDGDIQRDDGTIELDQETLEQLTELGYFGIMKEPAPEKDE